MRIKIRRSDRMEKIIMEIIDINKNDDGTYRVVLQGTDGSKMVYDYLQVYIDGERRTLINTETTKESGFIVLAADFMKEVFDK